MSICASIGQAAGTAAALLKREGKDASEMDVKKLQEILTKDGAFF